MIHPRHPESYITSIKGWLPLLLLVIANLVPASEVTPVQAPLAATSSDNSAQIVNYLLGKSSDQTGLNVNGDSTIDIADVVYAISHRVPTVAAFAIAGGAASTASGPAPGPPPANSRRRRGSRPSAGRRA
jgi:hypothetical protein